MKTNPGSSARCSTTTCKSTGTWPAGAGPCPCGGNPPSAGLRLGIVAVGVIGPRCEIGKRRGVTEQVFVTSRRLPARTVSQVMLLSQEFDVIAAAHHDDFHRGVEV